MEARFEKVCWWICLSCWGFGAGLLIISAFKMLDTWLDLHGVLINVGDVLSVSVMFGTMLLLEHWKAKQAFKDWKKHHDPETEGCDEIYPVAILRPFSKACLFVMVFIIPIIAEVWTLLNVMPIYLGIISGFTTMGNIMIGIKITIPIMRGFVRWRLVNKYIESRRQGMPC